MNLRCLYCQTPFTLSRAEMLNALVLMDEKKHSHYDAHCPRCRRANSISLDRLQLFYGPTWRQDGAKMKEAAAAAPVAPIITEKPAPVVKEKPAPVMAEKPAPAVASLKTEPLPKAAKPAAAKKPAAATAAKPAAKKPAAVKKTPATAAKPAAKKPAAAKKTPATSAKPAAKKPAATKKK